MAKKPDFQGMDNSHKSVEPKPIRMQCRNCGSGEMFEVHNPMGTMGTRHYRCPKCHKTMVLSVGGSFDL